MNLYDMDNPNFAPIDSKESIFINHAQTDTYFWLSSLNLPYHPSNAYIVQNWDGKWNTSPTFFLRMQRPALDLFEQTSKMISGI